MITKLLDQDGDIYRGIKSGWGVKGLLQKDVDIPGLAGYGIRAGLVGRQLAVVTGQVVEQGAHLAQTGHFIPHHKVGYAAFAVDIRATELIGCYVFAQHRLHYPRAGQAEKSFIGLDQEATLSRQVGATAGVEAEHAHDAGHYTADFAQCCKSFRIAVQTPDTGWNIGAGAVVDTNHGDALAGGELKQAGQLRTVGGVHRSGANREIVTVQSHIPAVDLDDCSYQ